MIKNDKLKKYNFQHLKIIIKNINYICSIFSTVDKVDKNTIKFHKRENLIPQKDLQVRIKG